MYQLKRLSIEEANEKMQAIDIEKLSPAEVQWKVESIASAYYGTALFYAAEINGELTAVHFNVSAPYSAGETFKIFITPTDHLNELTPEQREAITEVKLCTMVLKQGQQTVAETGCGVSFTGKSISGTNAIDMPKNEQPQVQINLVSVEA